MFPNLQGLAGLQGPRPMGQMPQFNGPQFSGQFGQLPQWGQGQFGGQNRQGFYDYLKSVGYTGEMGPDMRAYAQQLRAEGGHPRMDYRQSEFYQGPQMPGNTGIVPPAAGGSPVPQAQMQAPQMQGLAGLSMMRRPVLPVRR